MANAIKVMGLVFSTTHLMPTCTFTGSDIDPTKDKMDGLIPDLRAWFVANNLMPNDDKLISFFIDGSCFNCMILHALVEGGFHSLWEKIFC